MKKILLTFFISVIALTALGANYKSSNKCLEFIKSEETFSPTAYWDSNGFSIGYGHHSNVKKGDKITKATAIKYLKEDIKKAEKYVNYLISELPYSYKFSQGFIDGFTSFVYNVGVGNAQNSTFYKRLSKCRVRGGKMNESDFDFTLSAIKTSCVTANGHVKRRKGEYKLMKG